MSDKTIITIDMTEEEVTISADDYEIVSGSGEAPKKIEGGRSYIVGKILGVVARGLLDKDLATLEEYLEWSTKEFNAIK